jgi:hypothetical protein
MVAKLVGHRDGVVCVAFATSGAFAASVGFQYVLHIPVKMGQL